MFLNLARKSCPEMHAFVNEIGAKNLGSCQSEYLKFMSQAGLLNGGSGHHHLSLSACISCDERAYRNLKRGLSKSERNDKINR